MPVIVFDSSLIALDSLETINYWLHGECESVKHATSLEQLEGRNYRKIIAGKVKEINENGDSTTLEITQAEIRTGR